MLVDKNGAFARLLGVDLELPETKGPYQQRSDHLPRPVLSFLPCVFVRDHGR